VPPATGRKFAQGGFSSDPTELLATMRSGGSLLSDKGSTFKEYPRVTLQLDPYSQVTPIIDSVESRGYRGFSFAQEFEEITKFFIYFDMGLALIGLIALITASLGIVNTMIMAIMERRREIGVLKSLGASESDIRMLFLFETGLIGIIGSVGGILLGWIVSRICSAIAQGVMAQQGLEPIELFTLPWWLVGIALAFGLLVSIAAGAYPAGRASRVDPIQALRVE
jgi:putative ABC transport system permease protein